MTWMRPELRAALIRCREVMAAAALGALGLWLALLGGYVLVPAGAVIFVLGAAWAVMAVRRLRFAQAPDGPGVVELDEGQIGYLGPGTGAASGGYVSLVDLVELRLLRLRGRRVWRLKQEDSQALLIPVDAAGADRLFDAFTSLPGMDTAALVAALQIAPPHGGRGVALANDNQLIWARSRNFGAPGSLRR